MQDVKCGCGIPSDVKRFDARLPIRHGSVMRNDGRNAVWDMWCGLQCDVG